VNALSAATAAPQALSDGDAEATPFASEAAGRRVATASEYGIVAGVEPDDLYANGKLAVYPEVLVHGYATVGVRDGRLVLRAGGYVGLIPINDGLEIDVRPRVAVDKLERLLRVSGRAPIAFRPYLRPYDVDAEPAPSLLDMLTDALLAAVDDIGANGLHREYRTRIEDTSFPRGRILIGPTIQRHAARGAEHRAVASWFDHTADTGPNRCLKYALWFVARKYMGMRPPPPGVRRMLGRLNRAYRLYDGAVLDLRRQFMDDPLVRDPGRLPSVRSYYRPGLLIAAAIIHDRGVSLGGRGDDILMASLLVNMEEVFEAYIRAVLVEQLGRLRRDLLVLDGNRGRPGGAKKWLFDAPPSTDATPDIAVRLVTSVAGRSDHPVIVECKYKPSPTPDRDDLNQTITYGASYSSPSVIVCHPGTPTNRSGLSRLGTIGGMTVFDYAFDLAAGSLDAEEAAFGLAVARLLP
jgi:5-methylcytosine-specific restriction enzyme subunit McrC